MSERRKLIVKMTFSAIINTTTGKAEWKIVEDHDSESYISSDLAR